MRDRLPLTKSAVITEYGKHDLMLHQKTSESQTEQLQCHNMFRSRLTTRVTIRVTMKVTKIIGILSGVTTGNQG